MYIKIYGDYKIDFDDDIVHAIIELNRKGFHTKYCCSGHVKGSGSGGYVYFEKQLLKKYGLPVGWYLDLDYLEKPNTIRYDVSENVNEKVRQKLINIMMKNLSDWIETLPMKKTR